MDKTFIKDLLVRSILGVHDRERGTRGYSINITAFTDTSRRG